MRYNSVALSLSVYTRGIRYIRYITGHTYLFSSFHTFPWFRWLRPLHNVEQDTIPPATYGVRARCGLGRLPAPLFVCFPVLFSYYVGYRDAGAFMPSYII